LTATPTCRILLRGIYLPSEIGIEDKRGSNSAENEKDDDDNKVRNGVCHRRDKSSNAMDDGGGRHKGVGCILISGAYSVWTNESRDVGEEKNIPIRNEKHITYMEFAYYICNMLCKIQEKIQTE